MVEPNQPPQLQPSKEIFLDRYSLVKTLAYDEDAKVFLGLDLTTREYHAIKIIKHTKLNFNLEALKKEIQLLLTLKHPNIINVIDFHESVDYVTKESRTYKVAAIVMEFVTEGLLFDYVEYSDGFSEEIARKCFQVIIEALEYCHDRGVFHRDLKMESLMLDKDLNIKIVGFTSSALIRDRNLDSDNGAILDLFSASRILFYMVRKQVPFFRADPIVDPFYKIFCMKPDVFWKVHERSCKKDGQKISCSPELKKLITTMFDFEPGMRLSLAELKFHPWYQGKTVDINANLKELAAQKKEHNRAKLAYQKEIQPVIKDKLYDPAFCCIKLYEEQEIFNPEELDILKCEQNLEDYHGNFDANLMTELWTFFDPKGFFRKLYERCKSETEEVILSRERFKIKVKAITDYRPVCLKILLTKNAENMTCIEFKKKSGDLEAFRDIINEIKPYLFYRGYSL